MRRAVRSPMLLRASWEGLVDRLGQRDVAGVHIFGPHCASLEVRLFDLCRRQLGVRLEAKFEETLVVARGLKGAEHLSSCVALRARKRIRVHQDVEFSLDLVAFGPQIYPSAPFSLPR